MRFAVGCRGCYRVFPRAVERIELDIIDWLRRVRPAVDRAFDDVAKLADIARPQICVHGARRHFAETGPARPFEFGRHPPPEMFGQHFDIAVAHAQRRQRNDLEAQPVEQVGAEPFGLDHLWKVLVGGTDDPDIDSYWP